MLKKATQKKVKLYGYREIRFKKIGSQVVELGGGEVKREMKEKPVKRKNQKTMQTGEKKTRKRQKTKP